MATIAERIAELDEEIAEVRATLRARRIEGVKSAGAGEHTITNDSIAELRAELRVLERERNWLTRGRLSAGIPAR